MYTYLCAVIREVGILRKQNWKAFQSPRLRSSFFWLLQFSFSKKATKFEKIFKLIWRLLSKFQIKRKFCGFLKKLWLSMLSQQRCIHREIFDATSAMRVESATPFWNTVRVSADTSLHYITFFTSRDKKKDRRQQMLSVETARQIGAA